MNWLDTKPTLSGARLPLIETPEVFEQITISAECYASEPALIHGDAVVTYEELMSRVHDLQRQFVSLNIAAGSAVIVQLPRGIDYIITVLAILAHGSHFVPVAENEPRGNISLIIRRVDAVAHVGAQGTNRPTVSRLQQANTPSVMTRRLAYIMHTSGSTGVPKGAGLSLSALQNLLGWYGEELSVTPDSRFAHLSRPSFDFSIPEIFLSLMHGGKVIIPSRSIASGLIPVTEYLIEHEVTIIQLVPTLLRSFVSLLATVPSMASRLQSIDTIVCNGETLPDRLRQDVPRILPNATLVNSYGPTEACVAITWHRCSQQQEVLPNIIGRPAPNVDLYVMSKELEPVSAGTVGELWIGGIQVADGYIGAPVETQGAFIARHTSEPPSQISDRVYRTGDLVRVLHDGNLEFIGRRDRQVQLRGVRVEIGEIEAAVKETTLCNEVRVVPIPGPANSTADALICFVTPATVDTGELEMQTRLRLLEDRWPNRFHTLSVLPATKNGKVDDVELLKIARRLLQSTDAPTAQPEDSNQDSEGTFIRTPTEDALREVLAELVGSVPTAHESLHDLGIDSLARIELQVSLASRGYALPEEFCLDAQSTISGIADHMRSVEQTSILPLGNANHFSDNIVALRRKFGELFEYASEDATDLIVVQSSLPDFKKDASVHDVLAALLSEIDHASHRATIALPSYTLSFIGSERVDLRSDPSESGMLSSHVGRAIGGIRTRHPVYSFVVIGPEAQTMAEIDWAKRSAFGDDSIFGWFSARNTKYVLLGTQALAHTHRCEYLAQVPYMSYTYVEGLITDNAGTMREGSYVYSRDVPNTRDSQVLEPDMNKFFELGQQAIVSRDLGVCEATIINVSSLEQIIVSVLRRDPYALLKAEARGQAERLVQQRSRMKR